MSCGLKLCGVDLYRGCIRDHKGLGGTFKEYSIGFRV